MPRSHRERDETQQQDGRNQHQPFQRVEAEQRAKLEAPAKAQKARVLVDAEAAAEKRKIEALAEANAIFLKLDHQWITLGLGIEAELLYLAGLLLGAPYLRQLAAGLFTIQVGHLAVTGIDLSAPYLRVAQRRLGAWSRVALVAAAAERLPFADAEFDIATSLYLLHELPPQVRVGLVSFDRIARVITGWLDREGRQ